MKIAGIAAGLGLIATLGLTSAAQARDRHVEFSVNFGVPSYHYAPPPRPIIHHHVEYYPVVEYHEEYYEDEGHYHNGHYCRARHAHAGHHGYRDRRAHRGHERKIHRVKSRERDDD